MLLVMKSKILTIITVIIVIIIIVNDNSIICDDNILNDRVVIGVLAQFPYKDQHQYIAASYVKFLESSGARVAPVFCGRSNEYYDNLLSKLNGILLPGGGSPLNEGPYSDTVDLIIKKTIELNENGKYFPLWATCLSFEKLIANVLNNSLEWESKCYVSNVSLNVTIVKEIRKDPSKSRIFKDYETLYPKIFDILENQNVTANYHRICIEWDEWKKHDELTSNFTVLGYNHYLNNTFVSLFEHKKYPIYASMWHPEKNQFEFVVNGRVGNINHDLSSILVSQYFGNFFVQEARRSCAKFDNKLEESEHLIYNYNQYRYYTGKDNHSSFEETYKFPLEMNGIQSINVLSNNYHHLTRIGLILLLLSMIQISYNFHF